MTDNDTDTEPHVLILDHLRHIRSKVDSNSEELRELKARMTSVDTRLGLVHTDMAHLSNRLDRLENRLSRVETRLNLTEQPQ